MNVLWRYNKVQKQAQAAEYSILFKKIMYVCRYVTQRTNTPQCLLATHSYHQHWLILSPNFISNTTHLKLCKWFPLLQGNDLQLYKSYESSRFLWAMMILWSYIQRFWCNESGPGRGKSAFLGSILGSSTALGPLISIYSSCNCSQCAKVIP